MDKFKAVIVSKEELEDIKSQEGYTPKNRILDAGLKISGSSDAQVGAMLMYHITKLNDLIDDLPFLGILDGKVIICREDIQDDLLHGVKADCE